MSSRNAGPVRFLRVLTEEVGIDKSWSDIANNWQGKSPTDDER